jgi:tRNA A-37 threonylcarbamoyl transferase component Bud32
MEALAYNHTYMSLHYRSDLIGHALAVHQHGVIHNDMEPRNVVVSDAKVKIIDFGLAEEGHVCDGLQRCPGLLDLQEKI